MRLLAFLTIVAAVASPAAAAPNAFSDRLAKLDEPRRLSVLRRAVLDSGQRCKRAEQGARQGAYKNLEMWIARCNPDGDYALFIGPDASVQVRRCKETGELGLPACRLK